MCCISPFYIAFQYTFRGSGLEEGTVVPFKTKHLCLKISPRRRGKMWLCRSHYSLYSGLRSTGPKILSYRTRGKRDSHYRQIQNK